MKETPEQLRALLSQFHGPEQARQMAQEIERIESQMAACPAPAIRPEALSRIRNRVVEAPARKIFHLWRPVMTAAACLAIASTLFFINRPQQPAGDKWVVGSIGSWEEELLADAGATDRIASEIEEIIDQIQELQTSQWDRPAVWQQDLFELENSELITSTSFWKG